MKKCFRCERDFSPSSRHRLCPKCRHILRKKECVDCKKLIWSQGERCIQCANKIKPQNQRKREFLYSSKGYIIRRKPEHPRGKNNHGYIFDHILVMEQKLGRYLLAGENVHHVNGIRDDNRPENLELWIRPQPSGIRAKDAVIWARNILALYDNNIIMT